MSTTKVTIALVEDHALFRNMMADMINGLDGYEVVLQAAHGQEYVELAQGTHMAVAVVDLHMPVMDGFETIRWIREHQPSTRALALTFERTEEAMVRALRAGACGFLLKDVSKQVFRHALEQVALLGHYHDEEMNSQLVPTTDLARRYTAAREEALSRITEREIEFIRYVCDERELTYSQIADYMNVTERTVDGYREALFRKIAVKSKAGLVIFAFKWGIVRAGSNEARRD